ncbi:MAG: hypothetical protein ACTHJX_02390 [Terriglobales bacterium]
MPALRITVPPELRAAVEAALGRGAGERARVGTAELPEQANLRQRWQRLWLERRRGRGAAVSEAEAALHDASQRAVLALLDRQAEAVVLPAHAAGDAAWRLLEPRAGFAACAEVWWGETATGTPIAWYEWPGGGAVSETAEHLRAAEREVARWTGSVVQTVVVSFAGGPHAERAATERLLATLSARTTVVHLPLYSPFFYRPDGLQAAELIAAVTRRTGVALPLLCVPRLRGAELGEALRAAGGSWAGPQLAGAEAAAARLAPTASATEAAATCHWLLRAAACFID